MSTSTAGLIGVGILVLIGIPVAGFTRNQWRATSAGLRLVQSIHEVQMLKRADAAAFTQLIDAFRGRPSLESQDEATVGLSALAPVERASVIPVTRQASGNFWNCLTPAEQAELDDTGQKMTYQANAVLWRAGESAQYVILIMSGRTKICTERHGRQQIIAFRGPGDLIGERAALRLSSRSATVVAVEVVCALLITTGGFNTFVGAHPHLLDLIEGQVYERLTERNGQFSWNGQNCSILFTDIAGFGALVRSEEDRRLVRQRMYVIPRDAWAASGMTWSEAHHEDRGDGVLAIIAPDTPTRLLAGPLIGALTTELRRHNRQAADTIRIQLRVALHVGPVISDADGVSGDAIIHTARLLEAPILKRKVAATGADVGFIVSDFIHDTIVGRQGEYQRVTVKVKEARINAWMRLATAESREQPA